jgi:hypothetical protein
MCSPHRVFVAVQFASALPFRRTPSDESSCANKGAEKDTSTNMANAETNTTTTVAERGAHGAPESAPSKKGASRKKGAPKGQKAAKARKESKPVRAKQATMPRAESKGAQQARQALAYDRTRLLVFPLLSRFDSSADYQESQKWLQDSAEIVNDGREENASAA